MIADRMRILFACYDTGAANVISALLQRWPRPDDFLLPVAGGPAATVFEREEIEPVVLVEKDLTEGEASDILSDLKPDRAVFGSSVSAMLDRLLIREARKLRIPSFSIIDWWSNYGMRFSTPGTVDLAYLPDWIAVSDETAYRGCVEDGIPEHHLMVAGNPYWDQLLYHGEDISDWPIRDSIRNRINASKEDLVALVICGVIRKLDFAFGFDESDFWRILKPLPESTCSGRRVVWVALKHPREPSEEFRSFMRSAAPNVQLLEDLPPLDVLSAADCVFGMISTLQFEAALLRRSVLSLCPNARMEKLPFLEIFSRIGIITVLNEAECMSAVQDALNDRQAKPDLNSLPDSIKASRSTDLIVEKILSA